MKAVLVLALLGVIALASGAEWDALKVTYGKNGKGYYDLPWSVEEATAQGKWEKADEDKQLNVDVFTQPQDPRLMILFDKKGAVAGLRLAFLKDGIDKKAIEGGHTFDFEYDNNPSYEKGNYNGKDLWYTSVLLASPNTLASGGRSKLDKNTDSVAENIYFKHQGKWVEASRDECTPNPELDEANCSNGMGKHYFKKSASECTRREPVWMMYHNGKLVGAGLAGLGSHADNGLNTTTYYDQGPLPVQKIMRNPPSCVGEYINNYGLMSMHIFFTKDAAKVTCPSEDWHLKNC